MAKKKVSRAPKKVKNEVEFKNGLSDALFGAQNPFQTTQLSQADTLFSSNRWYFITNMRQLISEIYVEHGLIQTVIDVPVDDAFRGGVDVKTKQLSPEQVEELLSFMDEKDDIGTCAQGNKWNRLYGGAGIIIECHQDPTKPFFIESIKKGQEVDFIPADLWELTGAGFQGQNQEGNENPLTDHYDYYGKRIDKSRVLKLTGITAPSFVRPRLRGWGLSVCESLVRSINQYLKANNLTFEVLDEFKIDVYKFKNLTQTLLAQGGTAKVQQRVDIANRAKNYLEAVVLDGDDDWDHKQLSFTGLAEVMQGLRIQIASDLRMPLTKIFGISAVGFSSGEDDIENYNAMVESSIRQKAKFKLLSMVQIRCQQLFGMVPDDLRLEFKPLRILSSEQQENVKNSQFNRVMAMIDRGMLDETQVMEAMNKDKLLPIQLSSILPPVDPNAGDGEGSQDEDVKENDSTVSKKLAKEAPQ